MRTTTLTNSISFLTSNLGACTRKLAVALGICAVLVLSACDDNAEDWPAGSRVSTNTGGGGGTSVSSGNTITTTATLSGNAVSGAGVASGTWSTAAASPQTSRITVLASQIAQLVTSTTATRATAATKRTGAVNALLEINPTSISTANAAKNVGPITFMSGTGAVSAAGATNAITLYTDTYTGARLYLVDLTTGMAVGQGPQATAIPTTSVGYDGVIVAGTRANFADNSEHDQGEFEMTINFGSSPPTFTFATTNLTTAMTTTSGGTGTLSITDGRFQSSAGLNYGTAPATIYGQLHGAQARGLSGVWHVNGANPASVGAFLGSNYPYPSSTYTLSTLDADLHSGLAVKYGLAAGERSRTATHTTPANVVKSDIVFISSTVATDVSTSSASNQAWLTSALEATLADDSTRADGTGANQTFAKGRTATGIIAFETTRHTDHIARMYIVDNGDADRLLVAGPEYTSKTYLTTTVGGGATESARTLNYTGLATVPERLYHLYNQPPATVKFTATLIMTAASGGNPATGAFKLTTDVITGRNGSNRSLLEVTAALDLDTGRLTSDDGFLFYNGNETNVRSNTEVFAHEGFAGQVYGNEAQSVGGVFWGVQPDRTNAAGYFRSSLDGDKAFAGAFIGTKNP